MATTKKAKTTAKLIKNRSIKTAKVSRTAKATKKIVAKKTVKSKVAKKVLKPKIAKKVGKPTKSKLSPKPTKKTALPKKTKTIKPLKKAKASKASLAKTSKSKIAARAKTSRPVPKVGKAIKTGIRKNGKATPKVSPKVKLTPASIVKLKKEIVKLAKVIKAEKPGKIEKDVKVAKAAKGSIAPVAASTAIIPGKPGRTTIASSAPAAPVVTILAPTRALPKSLTVKALVTNVLPFNPNTKRVGGLLSEAEILKQPKSEYMSKAQLAFFKQRLNELHTLLRENAGQTTEHLRELSIVPDPADRATLEEEHALELRARDRERKLLKKVDAALLRLEDGSYGYCEETGDPIGVPRLIARPTATLTIEAQERRELKQRMFGE